MPKKLGICAFWFIKMGFNGTADDDDSYSEEWKE